MVAKTTLHFIKTLTTDDFFKAAKPGVMAQFENSTKQTENYPTKRSLQLLQSQKGLKMLFKCTPSYKTE